MRDEHVRLPGRARPVMLGALAAVPIFLLAWPKVRAWELSRAARRIPMPTIEEGRSGPAAPTRGLTRCTVSRIVDGDTLDCRPLGRIRFIGVDAPEHDQDPFGGLARRALEGLAPPGTTLLLERDREDRGPHKRALRYLWVDGVMINWLMVREGFSVVLTYPPDVRYRRAFEAAEDSARSESAGLWAIHGFRCIPRNHRRGRC
jgi:micrococcal nuclease